MVRCGYRPDPRLGPDRLRRRDPLLEAQRDVRELLPACDARADGQLSHSEVGVWRLGSPGRLELTIALAGSTEVAEGEVVDGAIETTSTAIGRAATSTKLVGAKRRYRVAGDTMTYEVDLETVTFAMALHLRATMARRAA